MLQLLYKVSIKTYGSVLCVVEPLWMCSTQVCVILYSLNILRRENFADFVVLDVISESLPLKYIDLHLV